MQLDDIKVEVRDRNLIRVGALTEGFTLEAKPLHSKVGSWTLTLPADHPLASALREPGSGLVVTGPDDVIISGPTTAPGKSVTSTDAGGTVTFTGACDNQWIADRLASPDPAWDGEGEVAADYDERTGLAETVIHAFVSVNAGPSAHADRQVHRLAMGTNLARGGTITKSARFDRLDELITGIATAANLGWRVVQRGEELRFETYEVTDRSKIIRLDTRNNTLSGYKMLTTAPAATHAIVGALDVDDDRMFATVTTSDSEAASAAWGRRVETFVNQAYVDNEDEWTAAAAELLAEQGVTVTSVQAIVNDDESLRFGRDYSLGDKVGIVADGREYTSVITGLVVKVDSAGVRLALALGDATVFNEGLRSKRRWEMVNTRVGTIERTQGLVGSGGGGSSGGLAGEIKIWSTNTAPSGHLLCDGSAVSRTTYAALFAVIGTTYGSGDGSTTFNLPNLKGRVPVGRDASQAEFDTLAETGGAKTHTLTTAEMPSHSHKTTTDTAAKALSTSTTAATNAVAAGSGIYYRNANLDANDTSAVGGGGAHNNLQPYTVLNYIIKT